MVENNEETNKEKPKKEEPKKEEPKKEEVKDNPLIPKTPNALDEAKEINEKKEKLLEREEKLMDRKEKLEAERMVGGGSPAGGIIPEPTELTNEEIAGKFEKGELDILSKDG